MGVHVYNNTFKDCGYMSNAAWGAGISVGPWGNGFVIEYNTFDGCYQEAIQFRSGITSSSVFTAKINNNNIVNTRGKGHATSGGASVVGYGIWNAVPTKFSLNIENNYFANNLNGNTSGCTATNNASTPNGSLPGSDTGENPDEPDNPTTPTRYIPRVRSIQEDWDFAGYDVYDEYGERHTQYVNGWPINIYRVEPSTSRVVATDKSPSVDGWNIGDFGFQGSELLITCQEASLKDAQASLSAWYARTPVILQIGGAYDGWYLEGVVTTHKSVVDIHEGSTPQDGYDYTISFKTSIPYLQNQITRIRSRLVYADGQHWSSDDTTPGDLVANGSMEDWPFNSAMSWTTQTSSADNDWRAVVACPAWGKVIAAAKTGTGNRVMVTDMNGSWWVPAGLASADNKDFGFRGGCFIPPCDNLPSGRAVFVSDAGTGNRVMITDDGENFYSRAASSNTNSWVSVVYIMPNETLVNGRLVACAYGGTNRIMYSDDFGDTWAGVTPVSDTQNWMSLAYSEILTRLVCVSYSGVNGQQVMYSDDFAATWHLTTTPAYLQWTCVVRAGSLGKFVAVADSGTTQQVMTSADGINNWTMQDTPAALQWRGLVWAYEVGLLVAVAQTGTGNRVMISNNAEDWTALTGITDNNWTAICWLPNDVTVVPPRVAAPQNVTINPQVSKIANWAFEGWGGGTSNAAPDGWTFGSAGQSRSTFHMSYNYAYKVTGDGATAVRGLISQATDLTPGYYTIGAWVACTGRTQGKLNIDLNGGNPNIDSTGLTLEENSQTYQYLEFREYINSTNPSLRIFVDGTPNAGSNWYVDSVIISPDTPDIAAVEQDTGSALIQTFTYNPGGVFANGHIMTKFKSFDIMNDNWTFAYPVTGISVTIDGSPVSAAGSNDMYSISTAGLSNANHTIVLSVFYSPIRGRFFAVGASGTGNRVMYSQNYGLIEGVAPSKWTFVSAGQTMTTDFATDGSRSLMITGDGVTSDRGCIKQPVACDTGLNYILSADGKALGLSQGSLVVEVFSGGATVKQLIWKEDTAAVNQKIKVRYDVPPTDAVIKVHGVGTPNLGAVLYCDNVSFKKEADTELSEVGNDIITYGNEDTIPDWEVQAVVPIQQGGSAVIAGTPVSFDTGTTNTYSSAATYYKNDGTSLEFTKVLPALGPGNKYRIDQLSVSLKSLNAAAMAYCAINVQSASMFGGVDTRVAEWGTKGTAFAPLTYNLPYVLESGANEPVTIKYFLKTSNSSYRAAAQKFGYRYTPLMTAITPASGNSSSFSVYNADDPLNVLEMCNLLPFGCKLRINSDYSGFFEQFDTLLDDSYKSVVIAKSGDTYDAATRSLTLGVGGYLTYKFDVKYPVTGIPFIQLFTVSGIPQVSISVDNVNWYNIDGNTSTDVTNTAVYRELENNVSLSLEGETLYYVKITPKAAETLTLGSIFNHADLVTIDALRPKIFATGQPNAFVGVLTGNPVKCTARFHDRNLV
jgi:hypothetical protein